ncbi:MAG TPA: hypothetical protein VLQ93_12055, partial [Myxococcaceae bacterium]|nr:hypothetical protein [Myxococcaceae bacterium]
LDLSSDALLSLRRPGAEGATPAEATAGEHPELSRIVHMLRGWPPERLALLRKLLDVADSSLAE